MKKEIRIYGIDLGQIWDGRELQDITDPKSPNPLSDEQYIEISEEHGLVWTLDGFQKAFNAGEISDEWYIRFI